MKKRRRLNSVAVSLMGSFARQTSRVSSSSTTSAKRRRPSPSPSPLPWVRRRMARARATTSANEKGLVT